MKSQELKFIPGLFMRASIISIMVGVSLVFSGRLSQPVYVCFLLVILVINLIACAIYNRVMDRLERKELYAEFN